MRVWLLLHPLQGELLCDCRQHLLGFGAGKLYCDRVLDVAPECGALQREARYEAR